jgi:hypothetical protein
MKVLTLAAGVAVGYVLGSRAGREKYDQIVETYHKVSGQPAVVRAQDKAKELIDTGTDKVAEKKADLQEKTASKSTATPRPPRRKPVDTTPGVVPAPLA